MPLEKFEKQPSEDLDYDIYFDEWMPDGDHIASVDVTEDTGITVHDVTFSASTHIVKVWASGGDSGVTYKVTVKATTASNPPRVKEQDFRIKVKER